MSFKVHVPSLLLGAIATALILIVFSQMHTQSGTYHARMHAVDRDHFKRIVSALQTASDHNASDHIGAHAGAHSKRNTALNSTPVVTESEAELKRRPYPEHIEKMRDPELHRDRANWQLQGFSRPFLLKQRDITCSKPTATVMNRAAVVLIRRIIDDPMQSAPANFTEPDMLLLQAVTTDPECISARLNLAMLRLAVFANVDRPWNPVELSLIDEFHSKTVTLADSTSSAPAIDEPVQLLVAKVYWWKGIIEELKTNTSSPTAWAAYVKASRLDPILIEEHIHPTRRASNKEILRVVFREADYWYRRGLVPLLFYYEFGPAMGGYPPTTWEDTQRFLRDWHIKVDNALPPFCFATIVRVYRKVFDKNLLAGVVGGYKGAATQESNSDAINLWYNIRVAEFVSRLAGTPVMPTYGYAAGYQAGDVLRPHTDRKACEFTLTTLIEAYPHPSYCPLFAQKTPWKIDRNWIGRYEEGTMLEHDTFNLHPQLNQWLVLRGRAKPHYRPALPDGVTCTTFLSHFVPVGEPDA